MVTVERLRDLYHYNPKTGIFTRLATGRYSRQRGRVRIRIDGKLYIASRLAWLYMTGVWPNFLVDHQDGDNTNNRWENLRDATHRLNSQNKRGVKGYTRKGGKYQAQAYDDHGNYEYLGLFNTDQEARAAYLNATNYRNQAS